MQPSIVAALLRAPDIVKVITGQVDMVLDQLHIFAISAGLVYSR